MKYPKNALRNWSKKQQGNGKVVLKSMRPIRVMENAVKVFNENIFNLTFSLKLERFMANLMRSITFMFNRPLRDDFSPRSKNASKWWHF
ncbi:MAG: hypothetical protein JKX79_07940 [Labilibaculum sp.]|nr:hypothetical protein [Labilibaculum sp.]